MTTTRSLPAGFTAPHTYVLDLVPADVVGASLDLSLVTAAELEVEDEVGAVAAWSAVRSNQTTTTLTLTHTLAAGEIAAPGLYLVRAKLTTAAGVRYAKVRKLLVQPAFA